LSDVCDNIGRWYYVLSYVHLVYDFLLSVFILTSWLCDRCFTHCLWCPAGKGESKLKDLAKKWSKRRKIHTREHDTWVT
jgi:hypothetical protein